jgi:hypothetical protein
MQEVGPAVEVSESFRVDSKMPSFMADILRKNEDEEAAKNGDNLTGEERREVTMSILKDHFGDRVIHYKKYSGTVEDIVDDCPAAYYYFKKGPEAFIEWVEAEETEPIHDTDDATNESREDEIFTVAEEGMVESSYADQQKDALAEKESLEVSKADQTASKNDEALDSIPDEQASAVDKAEPDRRDRSRVDKKANAERSEKTEKVSKDKKVDTSREKNKKQPTQSQVEAVVEVLQEPEVFKPVINIDAPNITNKPEQDVKTEKTDLVADEPSPEMAATQHLESFQTDSPEEDVPAEVNDAADSQSIEELQTNTDLIDEVLLNEDIEKPQSTQVVAQFENWQEFAKDEPLLDELFITMSEQLDTELFIEETDEAVINTESDVQSDTEPTAIEYAFEDFQKAEILQDLQGQEIFDSLLSEQASAELVTLLTAVRVSKKSVEKLYGAKTKEECAQYLNEIIVELTHILEALGYKYPEYYVRDFLSGHSIEALRSLINELEKSLRHAMYREVRQTQRHQAKHRQTRLGKFASYIMQAASSKLFVSQTTN